MAAYASLVSLMRLIDQIQHHSDPPLTLDPKQAQSLTQIIIFLQSFLEDVHARGLSLEIQDLESRMTDVAHAAEDAIESPILLASRSRKRPWIPKILRKTSTDFYSALKRVTQDMESMEKVAAIYRSTFKDDDQLPPRRSLLRPPLGSSNTTTIMVGFDDILIQIMDHLTRNQSRKLDIIPIVGMGGSGKTTLARNIYERRLIVEHFHTRSWVMISQEWVLRHVLVEVLLCQKNPMNREELSRKTEGDLGELLYKTLVGRKYLIVMDDVWSIEAWNKLKFFLPDNNNGSRIMITSRSSKLAFDLTGSHGVKVDLLDDDTSWDLLCNKVFGEKSCPIELEKTGRTIARNCRGLPLSIVTIGGLLAKFDMTKQYWEHVAKNLSSLVNSEDDERCLRILSLSYIHLPVHLKPCFLYMGLFHEDQRIRASHLIRQWVSEGFLKPINGKSLEVVAEDYLKDLVERNLVLVDKWGSNGNIRSCLVHDLLRDLCQREAQKEKFFSVMRIDNLQVNVMTKTQRRIAIYRHRITSNVEDPFHNEMPFLRSCIIHPENSFNLTSLKSVRLLRILASFDRSTHFGVRDIAPLVNLRFIFLNYSFNAGAPDISLFCSMSRLQTLMVNGIVYDITPLDIWKLPQLRHVKIKDGIDLSDPPPSRGRRLVLENLQTLSKIKNFKWSEEAIKRIPNIKKLRIEYSAYVTLTTISDVYCLKNLGRLQNLESLCIKCGTVGWCRANDFTVPFSLKKLTLHGLYWSDAMAVKVGRSLPLLEVLKLNSITFIGGEWNPVEGLFRRLKFLVLFFCKNLKYWNNADSMHFPLLEHLRIERTPSLEEFPSGVGDIATLRSIELECVADSIIISAKEMLEEQEEQLGGATLVIQVTTDSEKQKERLQSLASDNFKIVS